MAIADSPFDVAILGDSLSTGAGTHPALTYDSLGLWKVFNDQIAIEARAEDIPDGARFGLEGPLAPPVRAWPTSREFEGGFNWVFHNVMVGLSRLYLDTEQYSWGYLVSSGLGVPPERILFASENGHRTAQIPRQLDRVLKLGGDVLPAKVFIFFTGNDLCGPSLNFVTTTEDYENTLIRSMRYLVRNGEPAEGGTDVYLPAYLGVLQLLHSEDILAKKVKAHGEEITCKELRERNYRPKDGYDPALPPEAGFFGMMMPPNPAAFCPTLFGRTPGREAQAAIGDLANRIRQYRERQKKVVADMNRSMRDRGKALRFHYVEATGDLTFEGADVAQDCFHLSTRGQARLADAILGYVKGQ